MNKLDQSADLAKIPGLAGWLIELAIMEFSQTKLTPSIKLSRHGKHKNSNYHREYYQQNKEKILTYSRIYYGVKKISLTGAHNITFNKSKESSFFKESDQRSRRRILEEALDRELVRLATKLTKESKCQPLKKGWTCPNFREWLTKERLLELYRQ